MRDPSLNDIWVLAVGVGVGVFAILKRWDHADWMIRFYGLPRGTRNFFAAVQVFGGLAFIIGVPAMIAASIAGPPLSDFVFDILIPAGMNLGTVAVIGWSLWDWRRRRGAPDAEFPTPDTASARGKTSWGYWSIVAFLFLIASVVGAVFALAAQFLATGQVDPFFLVVVVLGIGALASVLRRGWWHQARSRPRSPPEPPFAADGSG